MDLNAPYYPNTLGCLILPAWWILVQRAAVLDVGIVAVQPSGGLSPGKASPPVAAIGRHCCANRRLQPHLLRVIQHLHDRRAVHCLAGGGGLLLLSLPASRFGLRPTVRSGLRGGSHAMSATRPCSANGLRGLPALEPWMCGPLGDSRLRPSGGLPRRPADLPTLAQGDWTAASTLLAPEWGVALGALHPEAVGAGSGQTYRDCAALSGLVLAPGSGSCLAGGCAGAERAARLSDRRLPLCALLDHHSHPDPRANANSGQHRPGTGHRPVITAGRAHPQPPACPCLGERLLVGGNGRLVAGRGSPGRRRGWHCGKALALPRSSPYPGGPDSRRILSAMRRHLPFSHPRDRRLGPLLHPCLAISARWASRANASLLAPPGTGPRGPGGIVARESLLVCRARNAGLPGVESSPLDRSERSAGRRKGHSGGRGWWLRVQRLVSL